MSAIELEMKADEPPLSEDIFFREASPFSIGIDGSVNGRSRTDFSGLRANFDHHDPRISRLEVPATCQQVHTAVRNGLFERFQENGEPRAIVRANHPDQDVCATWLTLRHHHDLDHRILGPAMHRLVKTEGAIDSLGGVCPSEADQEYLEQLAWVFEPYTESRLGGDFAGDNRDLYRDIVFDVEKRGMKHVAGKGKSVPLDMRYRKLGRSNGLTVVQEIGAQARQGMMRDGLEAYLSVQERDDGRYRYIFGLLPTILPRVLKERLDIQELISAFNAEEGKNGDPDRWGGSMPLMGSPMQSGSSLPVDTAVDLVRRRFFRQR